SSGKLNVKSLITESIPLGDFKKIYDKISGQHSIASILEYPTDSSSSNTIVLNSNKFESSKGGIGIVGAGNFTKMTMLPVLKSTTANLVSIASAGGLSGTTLAKKYGIAKSTTDYKEILKDENVDLVVITTKHNLHAPMVLESLKAGKHVFVEKPLALNNQELEEIIEAYNGSKTLTVGFNRRFSPHIQKIKQLVGNAPMNVIATMNAGNIPSNVWVHDMNVGGGRIIGEACHFIDLITYLTGS